MMPNALTNKSQFIVKCFWYYYGCGAVGVRILQAKIRPYNTKL